MVAVQLTRPKPFEPAALDCYDRLALSQKLLYISTRGLRSSIISHARAFTWNEVTVELSPSSHHTIST